MTHRCDLSIVLVSWNVWDYLRACLAGLENGSQPTADPRLRSLPAADASRPAVRFEVIVVDAASGDATRDLLPVLFPWVRLRAETTNVGYSRGNNLGAEISQGECLFFLNPDTLVDARAITTLLHRLATQPTIGAVGPKLIMANGRRQESHHRFPTRLSGFFESTWLGRMWPRNPWVRRFHYRDWPDDFTQDVDWLEGAALMVRRRTFQAVAGFDEAFFMYSEETDLCHRLHRAGWRVVYCPEARIVHYGGISSDQAPARTHIVFHTSKILYYRRYFGPLWAETLRRYLLMEFVCQTVLEGCKLLVGHRLPLRRRRLRAYRQVWASRLRPGSLPH